MIELCLKHWLGFPDQTYQQLFLIEGPICSFVLVNLEKERKI